MKTMYLDIMERALAAYSPERIRSYIEEVRNCGVTEHGFPRLGANIGILLSHGRCTQMLDLFLEIMELCFAAPPVEKVVNNFAIRELCCCMELAEKAGLADADLVAKFRAYLSRIDPWVDYTHVAPALNAPENNIAAFAAVSEFLRGRYLGIDTSEFVEWQLSSQLPAFDEKGMYQDPHNPMVYDLVTRGLLATLLHSGYRGKYAQAIADNLDRSVCLTLQMQSVTGELPFGGRSNQFYHNEAWLAAYCEMEAIRFQCKGDTMLACQLKAAAKMAAAYTLSQLHESDLHHIKNKYPVDLGMGCEPYGYFNKYMITAASFFSVAFLFADESIPSTQAPAAIGGYSAQTSEKFHQVFLNAGGYFLEFELDANPQYDANGLGRIHKAGCPSMLCLSVPFPPSPYYRTETENPGPMSLCCFSGNQVGAAGHYRLLERSADKTSAQAVFACTMPNGATVLQKYTISPSGVDIALSGGEDTGFLVPVFDFDGKNHTKITIAPHSITVAYECATCTYRFGGEPGDYEFYCNRNGRYRVYRITGQHLHIDMEG